MMDGFGTHLRAYLGLFQAVRMFEFVYVAPTPRLFHAAESEFHHVLYGPSEPSKCVSLLEYVRLRKSWDAKERVASADVVSLKAEQRQNAGTKLEGLYDLWRNGALSDDV